MKRIFLSPPHISKKEQEAVNNALESGWIAPMGTYIDAFTSILEKHYQSNILLTNSGTSAIHLALITLKIKKNDIVLCSNFTFAATAFPILYEKATPYFIGIERETWNISPEFLSDAISKLKSQGKKPKALLLAYSYGMPAKWAEIEKICTENDIIIIEDAAEAVGSTYNDTPLGTFGEFGILSFNGNKIITCSSGGALISKDKTKIEYSKKIASQAKEKVNFYKHNELGYNYLQSNILAAIGHEQFKQIENKVAKRRENFEYYMGNLEEYIIDYPKELKNTFSNRWLSSFIVKNSEKVTSELEKQNIESRKLWFPLNKQKIFSRYKYSGDHYENELFANGICLPSGNNLTIQDLFKVCEIIKKI